MTGERDSRLSGFTDAKKIIREFEGRGTTAYTHVIDEVQNGDRAPDVRVLEAGVLNCAFIY